MSQSDVLNLYNENNNIYNSPKRFNKTYNILNTYKFIKSNKTPVIKITKNLKKNFFSHNKRILSQNFIKHNYLYNHEKILTFHQKFKGEKNKRCKTFDINKDKNIFNNLSSLHKNILKGKLIHSKLYKLLEKSANDNYIKKKREKDKNTFITMIEEDDSTENENNKIFNFENEEEAKKYHHPENKNNKLLKNNKNANIGEPYKLEKTTNTMLLNIRRNISNINNFFLDPKLNNNTYRDDTNKILKKKVSFNRTFVDKNKTLKLSNLKPISLPSIKFNSALNNYFKYILEGNRNDKHTLSKTCIAKLRFEIINKALLENYKTTLEKNEFPINLVNTMFHYYLKEQKYFFEFDDLYKKYLAYLSLEIKKYKLELNDILEKREKIFNENNIILKKISDLKEELKIYEEFKKLCLMVKFKTKNINNIPFEEISKYGFKLKNLKNLNNSNNSNNLNNKNIINEEKKEERQNKDIEEQNSKNSKKPTKSLKNSIYKRRGSHFKDKNSSNCSNIKLVIPQETPIFENIDEFFHKFKEENDDIFKKFQIYNQSFYDKRDFESEFEKEKQIDQSPNSKYIKSTIKKFSEELYFLKLKNKRLNMFKNQLINQKVQEQNNNNQLLFNINNMENNLKDNNDNIKSRSFQYYLEENEDSIALFKIYKKVRVILLNPEINIENLLKIKKLYSIIKEKKTIKDIKFNDKIYSKEVFHIKILELLYLKLIHWKKRCLKSKYLRKKYLKIKNEREKTIKMYKSKKKLLDSQIHIMKRNDEIIDKSNKITLLQNRKVDPYYKIYLYKDKIKNEKKIKEEIDKTKVEPESDKYYNLIQY